MDWFQILTIIGSNAALFFWARSESRADIRHVESQVNAIRELSREIQLEMKDFHHRLLEIERDRK